MWLNEPCRNTSWTAAASRPRLAQHSRKRARNVGVLKFGSCSLRLVLLAIPSEEEMGRSSYTYRHALTVGDGCRFSAFQVHGTRYFQEVQDLPLCA